MSRQFAFKVCSHCFHFRLDKRSVWWYIDIVFVDVISISQQLQRNTNTTTNPCWWSTVDWIVDHVWSLQTITIGVLRLYGWWTQCYRIYEFPQELPSVCVAQLKATFPKAKAPCSEVILPRVLEGGYLSLNRWCSINWFDCMTQFHVVVITSSFSQISITNSLFLNKQRGYILNR